MYECKLSGNAAKRHFRKKKLLLSSLYLTLQNRQKQQFDRAQIGSENNSKGIHGSQSYYKLLLLLNELQTRF